MNGVYFMYGRKYNTEIKLEIVQRYLKGDISQKELVNEYGMASKADIQKCTASHRSAFPKQKQNARFDVEKT